MFIHSSSLRSASFFSNWSKQKTRLGQKS